MSKLGSGALLLSLSLVLACGSESPAGVDASSGAQPAAAVAADDHGHDHPEMDAVTRIAPLDIVDGMEAGTIVLLDVRSDRQYQASHIRGTLHIPAGELDRRAAELPRDRMIVTYCT